MRMNLRLTIHLLVLLSVFGGQLALIADIKAQVAVKSQRKVSGKVTDEKNLGLPGVSVNVKGTSKTVATDANGNYVISITEEKATLLFSYTGYITKEIAIESNSNVDVQLSVDRKQLEEIVVVGYGTQKK